MKDEIIQTLPSSLIGHMKSLKTLSYDDIHKCYLTDSVVTAIDFDKIPREYCKAITKTQMPCSMMPYMSKIKIIGSSLSLKMVILMLHKYIERFTIALLCYWK